MNQAAGNFPEIKVQLSAFDLYWYWLKVSVRYPAALSYGLIFAFLLFTGWFSGDGYTIPIALSIFIFGAVPWAVILLIWRKTFLVGPIGYVFSNSGISIITAQSSFFLDWALAQAAIENKRYLLVFVKNNFVLLPKGQVSQPDMTFVRSILRDHLKHKAQLSD